MSYTHILVPTDFSELSRQAVTRALEEADHHQASVTLLHVLQHPDTSIYYVSGAPEGRAAVADEFGSTMPSSATSVTEPIRRDFIDEAQTRLHDLVPTAFSGKCDVQTESGHPAEVILRLAKELSIDLIVMGTHGRSGLAHLLMGSVAEKVVRLAPCSVLVVR